MHTILAKSFPKVISKNISEVENKTHNFLT